MSTMTTYHDWREAFRLRAYELSIRGWNQPAIAEALGVTQAAVSKWLTKAVAFGPDALRTRKQTGRPPTLTATQLDELCTWLQQGAEAHGFQGDVWTSPRIAELMVRQWDIRLSDRQVRRILHHLGWSRQKPERRAEQRNDEAIAQWLQHRWPYLKRYAHRTWRTILFIDESGVSLLPSIISTWAPRGETPIVHPHLTKAHLSLISAVSPAGDVYYHLQRTAYNSERIISFLTAVHRAIPGKLLVIWDGAPIHRSEAIQHFLDEGAADWLRLEPLPGYAPELNPDEGIWRYLKYVELKNVCAMSLAALEIAVRIALPHMLKQTDIILSFFRQAGVT